MADDEIKIDFSKWFQKKQSKKEGKKENKRIDKKEIETENKTDDTISIDFSKMIYWMKNYWHILALLLIIIFVIDMRMKVTEAPITEDWARSTYYNYIEEQITLQIEQQNPNLPSQQKQLLITQQFNDLLKNENIALETQIKAIAQQYKDTISYEYNGEKYIYLGDIDSYYWLRFGRNIVEKGHICDEIREGICYDALAIAPLGRADNPTMHPYIIAWTYKVAQLIGWDIPFMYAANIAAVILAVLLIIPAFILGNLVSGKVAGIIIAILANTNIMHVQRTLGADNDSYALIMPLIILSFLFWAINSEKIKNKIIGAIGAGIFVGLFKFSWESGWWNIFVMIIYGFIIYVGFIIIQQYLEHKKISQIFKHKQLKEASLIFVIFYITGLIMFTFFISNLNFGSTGEYVSEYIKAPLGPLEFARFQKAPVNMNMWPNVITTVAEFNPLALGNVPAQVFGNFGGILFFFGIFGLLMIMAHPIINDKNKAWIIGGSVGMAMLFTLPRILQNAHPTIYMILLGIATFSFMGFILFTKMKIDEKQQHHIFIGIILSLWLIASIYATLKGVRFALLVAVPLSVAIACGIQILYNKIMEYFEEHYEKNSLRIVRPIILMLLLIAPLGTINIAYSVANSYIPNYNVAWDTALINIKDNSQPDAIVNSWWDFGHWFKYTTERGITLDGATQNGPQLHWLGKLLLTDDEQISRGILRMLDCGANTAFDVILNNTKDTPLSVDILNKIIVLDDLEKVKEILRDYDIPEEEILRVLEFSHCDAPENFLITSNDMISKGGVWAHFGAWDFYKAEISQMNMIGMSKEKIIDNLTSKEFRNSTEKEIDNLYNELIRQTSDESLNAWISPWPSFYGEGNCQKSGNIFLCDNGFSFNTVEKECYVNTSVGIKYPERCSYVDGENVIIKTYSENLLVLEGREIGIMLWPESTQSENTLKIALMHPKLVGSMFARLYFMQGHGLKYFNKFDEQRSPLGAVIYTWKVDWEGKDKIDVYNKNTTITNITYKTATETAS